MLPFDSLWFLLHAISLCTGHVDMEFFCVQWKKFSLINGAIAWQHNPLFPTGQLLYKYALTRLFSKDCIVTGREMFRV